MRLLDAYGRVCVKGIMYGVEKDIGAPAPQLEVGIHSLF